MKVAQRHQAILDLLEGCDANVERLSAALCVSEVTIRRDLNTLARERRLVRTYGGAAALMGGYEPEVSLEGRKAAQQEEKAALALAAVAHIKPGDSIMLDGGTTCAAFARRLTAIPNLHVITGNLLVVGTLAAAEGVRITLLGGELRTTSMSTLGPLAVLALDRLSIDTAFLSADGVLASHGLCEATAEQAYLKERIIERTSEVIVLADASKLGRARQHHWTPLTRSWRLMTTALSSAEQLAPFRAMSRISVEVVPIAP
ncbi:DeoR/GlpR family DNA-binding transcription regulator [Robbsia sp. Bb-Pol-6]|uniref:DeoR/GlpR family DNA-binding transcription regulator n=1 Tax=Robbsia betulipollinis TaxID=2981849 RepID=A0ABT3ZI52_9BURK|nr:DeoR/GlpR family DNA-binding transcription regulator [Robbsia betulipollinis]MCY0386191.1 DeoR/GlpR family DNA-binding transcription regulator [Robbsia betulipollinis]